MTPIEEHPELPEHFRSSFGGWTFSEEENGNLEDVEEAIAAWHEWRDFLVRRAEQKSQDPLF